MTTGTLVLTPGAPYDVLPPSGCPLLDLSDLECVDADWTARSALAIQERCPETPLLLVIAGPWAQHAPALGFAQRAARRAVHGYVLVDPRLPAPGQDWPDAPVVVIVTPEADEDTRTAALGARLRGWEVIEAPAAHAIVEIAARP